ncbi:hypothetical protein V6N13_127783 [Hibiscus sabdariffa]
MWRCVSRNLRVPYSKRSVASDSLRSHISRFFSTDAGGINAALGNMTEDDWRWHMYDTVKGSDWLVKLHVPFKYTFVTPDAVGYISLHVLKPVILDLDDCFDSFHPMIVSAELSYQCHSYPSGILS